MLRVLGLSIAALMLVPSSAFALTVINRDKQEITIGVDSGNKEEVQKVPAGKSLNLGKFCAQDGCGISGPWGYSVLANANDTVIYSDGLARLSTSESASGRSTGEMGRSR
jgi:hypothetical protein